MECAATPYKETENKRISSLNPCSNGMRRDDHHNDMSGKASCLNPCSNGMRRDFVNKCNQSGNGCLNPCSNGMRRDIAHPNYTID